MFIDIVIPDGNEAAFIAMAERLGIGGLCFLYAEAGKGQRPKVHSSKVRIFEGGFASAKTMGRLKASSEIILMAGGENPRETVEKFHPDIMFDLESSEKKDYMHQRNSGLNHIICRAAAEKDVAIGFSFACLLGQKRRAIIAGRMQQNIRLCRKYAVATAAFSLARDPYLMRGEEDLRSLLLTLGMESGQAKKSLREIYRIISRNQKKKSFGYVSEGIDIIR